MLSRYVKEMTLVLGCVASSVSAQQPPRARFPAELDRYIAKVLVDGQIPGLAIAVVRNDSVLIAKGYGDVDANTVFDAASLTKSFTATLAAILVDRGAMRWDDPVRRYLPDLVLADSALTARATLRDFLSHRTGLESANMAWVLTAVDRPEMMRRLRYLRVVAPLGQSFLYNNLGYMVAGEAIGRAGGTSYEALLRDVLIKPLGLSRTTWTYAQASGLTNVAISHATIAGRQQPIRRETQRHVIDAASAVQSSVTDLARWMRLHLNNGVLDGVRYVSDSAMRALHSLQVVIPTTPAMRAARLVQDTVAGYGMGLQVMDYRGHPLLWHTGGGDGQMAYMALLPRDRLGVVVLVNTWSVPFIHGALVNRILDTYLGYEPRDWAGETLARIPAQRAAADSAARAMTAMRSASPPPLPLASYAGRYDNPLYGPIWIRLESTGLTLQVGEGQVADLEYHGGNGFYTRWRDPLYAESYGTHIDYATAGSSVTGLSTRINRDEIVAGRAP
jgi:CubicO group peptidase (beta-lactamase class C family)